MLSKRTAIHITVCLSVFALGIITGYIAASGQREVISAETPAPVMASPQEEIKKEPQPAETDCSTFFVQSVNETIYVYQCDSSGNRQMDNEITYIDIYSLDPAQQNALKAGISLPDREAVAEFIQDLGT